MKKIVTAAEMREIDRLTTERYAIPSLLLMQAAANASAREIAAQFSHDLKGKTFQILCGRGNNGGDGAALARTLWTQGARVDVVLFGGADETKGDARANFEIVRRLASFEAGSNECPPPLSFVECKDINAWEALASAPRSYDCIVDALFGTGLTRPLEGFFAQVVAHLELLRAARTHAGHAAPLFVSLDLPSGLNADARTSIGPAVRSDLTVTFTAAKQANVLPPASHLNGRLAVADIGSPPALVEAAPSRLFLAEASDARAWLEATRYTSDSYKNTHGHAFVVAGSRGMTGAAVLCADAAMAAGVGLVTLAAPESALPAIAPRLMPEVMTTPLNETEAGSVSAEAYAQFEKLSRRATVLAVGCGLDSGHESTRRFVREAFERRRTPLVIDADGLNSLSPWPSELKGTREAPVVLTPHEGEMLRLLGAAEASALDDRARVVAEFASAHSLFVVLKGTRTLVAAPDGRVFVNPTGNAGLGTAGSGDTLTGIITGFLAQEFAAKGRDRDALAAVLAAVYVAGLAGDLAARELGMRTMVASDVRKYLGAAVRALDLEGETP
ncbi:MAG: ADP-dependent NAD(P)H-hydrate dehydratase / NAD(P)H-hydrate epimerase [Acidobacteriota bacterium]|nr:ADP-dependent NAD(P)H-hydrate dehydratase / NAD(P)H-hydrate epimerase [Acidobacteriota bacterium]